jgi:hypothetical protein
MSPLGKKKVQLEPEFVGPGSHVGGVPATAHAQGMATLQGQATVGTALPGPAPHTAGPHRHDILNKLDPTVDSQSGGAQILGPGAQTSRQAYAPGQGLGTANANAVPAGNTAYTAPPPGVSAAAAPVGNVSEGTYGPHSSRLANAVDPRVDSDLDGGGYTHTRQAGMAPGAGAQMANPRGEMYGRHQMQTANTHDARMDLDPNIRGAATAQGHSPRAVHVGGTQPGPAPNTAGPHRTDIMNKLDPTVDSKRVI